MRSGGFSNVPTFLVFVPGNWFHSLHAVWQALHPMQTSGEIKSDFFCIIAPSLHLFDIDHKGLCLRYHRVGITNGGGKEIRTVPSAFVLRILPPKAPWQPDLMHGRAGNLKGLKPGGDYSDRPYLSAGRRDIHFIAVLYPPVPGE